MKPRYFLTFPLHFTGCSLLFAFFSPAYPQFPLACFQLLVYFVRSLLRWLLSFPHLEIMEISCGGLVSNRFKPVLNCMASYTLYFSLINLNEAWLCFSGLQVLGVGLHSHFLSWYQSWRIVLNPREVDHKSRISVLSQ